jgi:acyl-CoA reductase-like NAD-dependent aldehyde dehydrogenase
VSDRHKPARPPVRTRPEQVEAELRVFGELATEVVSHLDLEETLLSILNAAMKLVDAGEPYKVAIAPFNFPLNLVAHKVAPALAAGNPVLVKPSTRTPLSGLALAEPWPPRSGPRERSACSR